MASLADLGRRRFASVSALSEILKELKEHGMPENTSKSSIKRSRDAEFSDSSSTPYGSIMQRMEVGCNIDGMPLHFWYANPRATLYYFLRDCPRLETFLKQKLLEHPSTMAHPWSLVLYNDEVVGGNPLKHDNHRKLQAFYYSYLELGLDALSSEFLWFTLTVARSEFVKEITGLSMGHFTRDLMLSLELMATEGFVCGDVIIWAKLTITVSDEAALKSCFDVKGASGLLPCAKCRNVSSKKFGEKLALEDDKMGIVTIAELDFSKFEFHDDKSFVANAHYLHDQKPLLGKGKFAELETSLGMNYAPDGVALCTRLMDTYGPISGWCYDWMHVYFVNGIYNHEVGCLLRLLKQKTTTRHTHIDAFFQDFVWPFKNSNTGKSVFEKRNEKNAKKGPTSLACAASEGLGSFALLKEFLCLQVFANGDLEVKTACVSYYALCDVINLLTMTARGNVSMDKLHEQIVQHLSLHKKAYGADGWLPKMHYAMHLSKQACLVSCFTHERKHKELKRYMDGRMNTSADFEKSILQDVFHMQRIALRETLPYPTGTCLLNPRPAPRKLNSLVQKHLNTTHDVQTAVQAKVSSLVTCHVNDVAFIEWHNVPVPCKIIFLCSVAGNCMAGVRLWTKMPQYNMYNTNGGQECMIPLKDVIDTCIHRVSNGIAFVVIPRGLAMRA